MNEVLFESKVKVDGAFFKKYLFLDEKKFEIKKKKSMFSSEYEVVFSYLIKDIKMTNNKILVRVKDSKYVEVILENKTLLLKFNSEELASDFASKLIELKEKDTFLNRSLEKVKGIDLSDVRTFVKLGSAAIGLVSNFVKNEKIKKGLKTASVIGVGIAEALDVKE